MIKDFYKDCDIFFTGGSGNVGKAAIEKLLRSCDVNKIYVLLRTKQDFSVEQRLEKLKSSKIFRVLKTQKANELDKIVPIPGDAMLPNLGITAEYAKILENVAVFFHCAATVRFDEKLKMAVKLNVGGTFEALKFAETLKKLKIFVHVSTFFSNPYLTYVDSKVYASPMDWKFCLETMGDENKQTELNILTKKIITGFPNTYCFTKNLAESVVNDFRTRLPIIIYRPSIVLFAVSEPEPGFPLSITGAIGLFALAGAGLLKCVYMKKDIHLDVTPFDVGSNIMLASSVKVAKEFEAGALADVPVYIASSWSISSFTFPYVCKVTNALWHETIFEKSLLIPYVYTTECRFLYMFMVFTTQILPALLTDGLLRLFGRKPVVLGIIRKGYTSVDIMKPFLFNNYESGGVTKLDELYKITDGTEFDLRKSIEYCISKEGLEQNIRNMLSKIREVLLYEDPSTIGRSQKILKAKYAVYNIVRGLLAYYLLRWIYGYILREFF